MSKRCGRIRGLSAHLIGAAVVAAALSPIQPALAQGERDALIQIEVSDSLGLPLPDAAVEVFTLLEGGVFWEWARVGAADLPAGINLLRFSHPGYRASMFSVPLRPGGKVSLRVRLMAEGDTTRRSTAPEAREVRAIGLALEGKMRTDIIGHRRIVDRSAVESDETRRFGSLMRRVRGTELNIFPATGGSFRVMSQGSSGGSRCPVLVMVNGDRRRVFSFPTFDQLYGTADLEMIEVFPRGTSIPYAYQVPRSSCGLLAVWFKNL